MQAQNLGWGKTHDTLHLDGAVMACIEGSLFAGRLPEIPLIRVNRTNIDSWLLTFVSLTKMSSVARMPVMKDQFACISIWTRWCKLKILAEARLMTHYIWMELSWHVLKVRCLQVVCQRYLWSGWIGQTLILDCWPSSAWLRCQQTLACQWWKTNLHVLASEPGDASTKSWLRQDSWLTTLYICMWISCHLMTVL